VKQNKTSFGGQAALASLEALGPLALRPCLSTGLPLSVRFIYDGRSGPHILKQTANTSTITFLNKKTSFGGQAALASPEALGPLALRPDLSAGLPLSCRFLVTMLG